MTEELKTIDTVDLSPFKKLVMTIGELPTSFVESMTYYEALAWFVNYLQNTIIPTVNNNAEAVEELQELYIELKEFVDNYFDNLDVQEEIDNKLDEMTESGALADIVADYIQLRGVLAYDSVADMKAATNLVNGSFAQTYGFYGANDGGGAKYKIRTITNDDVIDEMFVIAITNNPTLIAELVIENELHTKQIGLKGDDTTDETTKLNTFFSKSILCNKRVIDAGVYKTTGKVNIKGVWKQDSGNNGQKSIIFDNATIHYTGNSGECSVVLYNMFKTYIKGLCITRNSEVNYVSFVGCWHVKCDNFDVKDIHITNESTDITGLTSTSNNIVYLSFDTLFCMGTLYITSTSSNYINCVNFYNSVINPYTNSRDYCVVLGGALSKQEINFTNCDLSYAKYGVFNVLETQTGHCSINCYGCYFDSSIPYFYGDDKKGAVFNNMYYMAPAYSATQIPNLTYHDFVKNTSYTGYGTVGSNLAIANINYVINGNISYTDSSPQAAGDLFGANNANWTLTYITSSLSISGNARKLENAASSVGNRSISVRGIEAPRDGHYLAYARLKITNGSCETVELAFKSTYMDIDFTRLGNNEFIITNDKKATIETGTPLSFNLLFKNASIGMTVEVYEVGVTDGSTYIPNAPLHANAILTA